MAVEYEPLIQSREAEKETEMIRCHIDKICFRNESSHPDDESFFVPFPKKERR